jgi:hypothetical protein
LTGQEIIYEMYRAPRGRIFIPVPCSVEHRAPYLGGCIGKGEQWTRENFEDSRMTLTRLPNYQSRKFSPYILGSGTIRWCWS